VIDHEPRSLTVFQSEALLGLSRQVSALLELRRTSRRLQRELLDRDWYEAKLKEQQSELERENAELAEQSRTDALTGLPNRRSLGIELASALESARADGTQLAFALVDVDHFKTVNDLHGHAEGDRTLVAIAHQLQAHRAGAFVARYGGEEFAILMPRVSMASARLQCEFLRESVQSLVSNIPVTVSIGVAVLDRRGDDVAALCARADRALYAAKRAGRNRVEVAAPR